MDSKQKGAIIIAVIAAVGAAAGGTFMLDFSTSTQTETNISGDTTITGDTIIHEGDTIINEIIGDVIEEGYDFYCEEVDPDSPECDAYWDEP